MNQRSLLPLDIVALTPTPFGTRDLSFLGNTANGQDWAIKSLADDPLLPISEYLGYRLAEAAQIGVPYWHVLRLPDGAFAFGSRFEGGIAQWGAIDPADQAALLSDVGSSLTRILTFDRFYGNDDRHLNNLLFRANRTAVWTAMAFDFSRAGPLRGFPPGPPLPLPGNPNTELSIGWLRQIGHWDGGAARLTIASLQAIGAPAVGQMLADAPESWFDATQRTALVGWWDSPARNARLQQLLSLS